MIGRVCASGPELHFLVPCRGFPARYGATFARLSQQRFLVARRRDTQATILLSFAHPDDESFFPAGIACAYAARGARVVLSCATRGEAGSAGHPPLATREELPKLREQELRDAAAVLGISHLTLLDYRDRELADAPTEEIRAKLVRLTREHRPQVVITFDPDGGNRHPDHVAISRFTADAVTAAAG